MIRYNGSYDSVGISDPDVVVQFGKQSIVHNPSYPLWISSSATGSRVIVGGEISSDLEGIYSGADDSEITVTRTGLVHAETAMFINGENQSLDNRGTITALNYGIVSEGLEASIVNSGLISAPIALSVHPTDGTEIVNERGGEIIGMSAGVLFVDVAALATAKVVNHGLISSPASAILGSVGSEEVTNRGKIIGDIDLRAGSDVFDGRQGAVAGDVRGGAGNDAYFIDDGRTRLVEEQNGGDDRVYAFVDYTLSANIETLFLRGRKDLVAHGNDGDNTIIGNSGDNVIYGHDGDNLLQGGRGDDLLIGGNDRDVFVFDPGDGHDTIRNFEDGTDIFNLAGLKGFDDFEGFLKHARQRNGDVILSFGRDQLTIEDFSIAQLDASDFPG